MLSSNNQSSQITAAVANDQRKAVKKLTVGVSSILLGFAFAGATTAHADTTTQPVDDAEHVSATTANQTINNSTQVLKTAAATSATDVNSVATSTMQNSASSVNSAVAAASAVSNTSDTVAATSQSTSTKSGEQQAATAADNYEAAVNATLKEVTPSLTPASASDVANSASTAQTASSAVSQSQAQASTAIENPEVAAVPMTNYDVQPYSQAQREANAQAGLKIATDFVNILTAPTLTAKIGQGITFIKDTVNLITRHPLAYQRYQCMTARQIRLANQQHALALKQKQMEAQHKAQWKINFIISQQRFLANWQQRLAIQRQTMVGYLRANTNISSFAFA